MVNADISNTLFLIIKIMLNDINNDQRKINSRHNWRENK